MDALGKNVLAWGGPGDPTLNPLTRVLTAASRKAAVMCDPHKQDSVNILKKAGEREKIRGLVDPLIRTYLLDLGTYLPPVKPFLSLISFSPCNGHYLNL